MATKSDNQLATLLRQHEALTAKIEAIQAKEKQSVIEQIRATMTEYGITLLDIEGRKRAYAPRKKRKEANGAE